MINENEYVALALPEIHKLLDAIDRLDSEEVEAELESDILTIEFGDGSRPLPHARGVDAALDAVLEQHLHPDADAEHRAPARQPAADQLVAATRLERLHDRTEGADAGHHEPVGLEDEVAVGRQARVGTGGSQRLDGRVHVARSVVEDRDEGLRAHRAPLVLGMPSTSGSSALAWRKARANALYSASAM